MVFGIGEFGTPVSVPGGLSTVHRALLKRGVLPVHVLKQRCTRKKWEWASDGEKQGAFKIRISV